MYASVKQFNLSRKVVIISSNLKLFHSWEEFSSHNGHKKTIVQFFVSWKTEKMNKLLRLFKKKPRVVDYWDCSRLNLVDLPKEVLQHRDTIETLYMQSNNVKDIPKVSVAWGQMRKRETVCVYVQSRVFVCTCITGCVWKVEGSLDFFSERGVWCWKIVVIAWTWSLVTRLRCVLVYSTSLNLAISNTHWHAHTHTHSHTQTNYFLALYDKINDKLN